MTGLENLEERPIVDPSLGFGFKHASMHKGRWCEVTSTVLSTVVTISQKYN